MQKFKIFNLLLVLLGVYMFTACEYATIEPEVIPPKPAGDTTSFSLEVQPYFTKNCAGCHNGSVKPDLRDGRSYESLFSNNMVVPFKPAESVIYTCLLPGASMAKYAGSPSNALMIKYWIEEGAKNN